MEKNCKKDGFLRKHFIDSYSTVFPPTTVAATTSAMSGLQPIEPRALNLYVKDQMREQFEAEFMKEFGRDFLLLTKEEVYRKKLFGTGIPHENVDAMIGDYVAIAITDLTIFNTGEEAEELKGVHAGYTREEMTIPFIVFE